MSSILFLQTRPLSLAVMPVTPSSICVFLFIFTAISVKVPSDSIPVSQKHSDLHPHSHRGGGRGWRDGVLRWAINEQIYKSPSDNLPSIQPLNGSRFNSIWSLFSKSVSSRLRKKEKKIWRLTHRAMAVCLCCCQQRGGEIYVLVLGGARAFDPCIAQYFIVSGIQRDRPLRSLQGKKKRHQSFRQGRMENGGRERESKRERWTEHEWALYRFQRA